MKEPIRTFVAVEIDEPVRRRASELIAELREAGATVSWVKLENMHLTLKFLGDVSSTDIPRVCETVKQAAEGVGEFEYEVRGAGAFPRIDRPTTVWLGGGNGTQVLVALADRIDAALGKIGFRREDRAFTPHLTLGRIRKPGPNVSALAEQIRRHTDFTAGSSTIREVVIFSSRLHPSGSIYEPLCRATLSSAARP